MKLCFAYTLSQSHHICSRLSKEDSKDLVKELDTTGGIITTTPTPTTNANNNNNNNILTFASPTFPTRPSVHPAPHTYPGTPELPSQTR